MNSYLQYLGWYSLFIPVFSILFLMLLGIIIFGKLKGPQPFLATLSFYIPMIGSILLGILLFYTSHFWITLAIYTLVFIVFNLFSFSALDATIEDKSGLGVTMFSGLISLYAFFFCALLRFIISLF